MKTNAIITFLLMLALPCLSIAQKKEKQSIADNKEIHWISLSEAEKRMKDNPKFVYVDFYTNWCGWCKVMDAKTFSNPQVIQYINKNFYAVKFNTEVADSVYFQDKYWNINPQYKTNDWAIQMLNGQLSYPTSLIMDKNFMSPIMFPGYLDVKQMEAFLKFLSEGHFKTEKWDAYFNQFKPTWQ